MRKYIILDGCDHAGKTNIAHGLAKAYPDKIAPCKFPSDDLADHPVFLDVVKLPNLANRTAWLEMLTKDVEKTFAALPDKPVVLIDRLWISTLLYQGDGLQSLPEPFQFESTILHRFRVLFESLDIPMDAITTIVFRYPLVTEDMEKRETNPAKAILDQRVWHYTRKLTTLIKHAGKNPQLTSPLWKQTRFIAEDIVRDAADSLRKLKLNVIEALQKKRLEALAEMAGLSTRSAPVSRPSTGSGSPCPSGTPGILA